MTENTVIGFLVWSYFTWIKHIVCDVIGYKPKKTKVINRLSTPLVQMSKMLCTS